MTKAEKALAIERVGSMVWGGAMDMSAAIWFLGSLLKLDWFETRDIVHDAMVTAMAEEVNTNLVKIGDKNA